MVTSGATETLRAVPLLSHAYHEIKRVYPDSLELDVKDGTIEFGSHSGYEEAVQKTVSEIKIAYTKGWLDENDIRTLIQLHLPEELQIDTDQTPSSHRPEIAVGLPSNFDHSKTAFLQEVAQTLEKKHGSQCVVGDSTIIITADDYAALGGSYEAIDYTIDFLKSNKSLPKGEKALKHKAHQIARSFHPMKTNDSNDQLLNIYNNRSDQVTTDRRHQQIHVFDHLRHFVTSIDSNDSQSINLRPLASFLHSQKEHLTNTLVFRLNETEIHLGKNNLGDEGFYIYTPRYTNDQVGDFARRDRQLKLAYSFLNKLANFEGQQSAFELSEDHIAEVRKQIEQENQSPSSPFMSFEEVNNLTLNELELAVLDLDLPIVFDDLIHGLGVDIHVREHVQIIQDKLETLTERGILKERKGKFSVPTSYSNDETYLRVIEEKENGYVLATPLEWDEKLYGVKPRLYVSPKYHDFSPLALNDTLKVSMDFEQGRITHLEIQERMSVEQFVPFLSFDEFDQPTSLFQKSPAKNDNRDTSEGSNTINSRKKFTGNVRKTQGTRPDNKHNPQARKLEKEKATALKEKEEAKTQIPEDISRTEAKKEKRSDQDKVMAGILIKDDNDGLLFQSVESSVLRQEFKIASSGVDHLKKGDIAYAKPSGGNQKVRITDVLGNMSQKENYSILQAAKFKIPMSFSEEALAELEGLEIPEPNGFRKDFRDVEACTIDGADARDFDDAVYVEKLPNGDFLEVNFIADVDHYVNPNSVLDKEARIRGNSVYFPNMVIPMLPKKLSEGLCSLNPNEDRACLAWEAVFSPDGTEKSSQFSFGVMRSRHRLTYEEVQKALDGEETTIPQDYVEERLKPLNELKIIKQAARLKRGALELEIDEQKVFVDDNDNIIGVGNSQRLEAHKIIEEMMLAENVASYNFVKSAGKTPVARIHDRPDPERVEKLRQELSMNGITLPEINVASDFNSVIQQISELENSAPLKESILRTQARAAYSMANIGHFGLGYDGYSHTTSPIRRYPDLEQHRQIKSVLAKKGPDYLSNDEYMEQGCQQWSLTERRADDATNAARKSYAVDWLIKNAGKSFDAEVSHVTNYGYYVTVGSGAEGLIHIANMNDDYYEYNQDKRTLNGKNNGQIISKGDKIKVMLEHADAYEGVVEFSRIAEEKPYQPKQSKQTLG